MKLIVDAGISVEWFFAESHTAEARRLPAHRIVLHASGLMFSPPPCDRRQTVFMHR